MYQYGAGAGNVTRLSWYRYMRSVPRGNPPARRGKKTLGGAAGVPRPVPKAACPCRCISTPVFGSAHAQRSTSTVSVELMSI